MRVAGVDARFTSIPVIGANVELDVVRHLAWRMEELELPLLGDLVDMKTLLRAHGPVVGELFSELDVTGSGRVLLPEILAGLTLLAADSREERFRLLFDLFDWDSDGFMPAPDMALLLGCVSRGVSVLGGMGPGKIVVSDVEVRAAEALSFAKVQVGVAGSGSAIFAPEISRRLFVVWALRSLRSTMAILDKSRVDGDGTGEDQVLHEGKSFLLFLSDGPVITSGSEAGTPSMTEEPTTPPQDTEPPGRMDRDSRGEGRVSEGVTEGDRSDGRRVVEVGESEPV